MDYNLLLSNNYNFSYTDLMKIRDDFSNMVELPDIFINNFFMVKHLIYWLIPMKKLNYNDSAKILLFFLNNIDNIQSTKRMTNNYEYIARIISLFSNDVAIKLFKKYVFNKNVYVYLCSCSNEIIIKELILNHELSFFDKLTLSEMKQIFMACKNLPGELSNNKMFISIIAGIDDEIEYYKIINILHNKIDISEIEIARKKNIKNKFVFWIDKLNDETICEDISYYFFGDCYHNVILNINEISNFLANCNTDIINDENIEFYKKFSRLKDLSDEDKITFFKNYLYKENISENFYDDIRKIKNLSYDSLINSAINLDKNIYNKLMSEYYGIPIYYLNGNNFYAFIRCLKSKRDQKNINDDYINSSFDYTYSFSYIGDSNIGTIRDVHDYVAFLYSNIKKENIVHIYHDDSYSLSTMQMDYISFKVNELHTPKSLIENTSQYNEIIIKKSDSTKPAALICYDRITNNDVLFAKKLNMPILLINTAKYIKKEYVNSEKKKQYIL